MKKPKKTPGLGTTTTHQHKKTASKKEDKKPKQYKSKEDRVADYEELPVIVRFEI